MLAASLLLPAGLWASTAKFEAGSPTSKSHTWDFAKEANQLFGQISNNANNMQREAEELNMLASSYRADWMTQANLLQQIRGDVNDMGDAICRLQVIRRAVLPWQKEAIERATPMVTSLVHDTQEAIVLLNDNHSRWFATDYVTYASRIYDRTERIKDAADRFVQYAQVRQQLNHLENTLELSGL